LPSQFKYHLDSDLNLSFGKKPILNSRPRQLDSNDTFNSKKLVKLLKTEFQKMDDQRQIITNIQQISIEWKEVARRLEVIIFIQISTF